MDNIFNLLQTNEYVFNKSHMCVALRLCSGPGIGEAVREGISSEVGDTPEVYCTQKPALSYLWK